jgi:hypothetical protein
MIKFSIYLCYKLFLCFKATFCFTNPYYRLIWTILPTLNYFGLSRVYSTSKVTNLCVNDKFLTKLKANTYLEEEPFEIDKTLLAIKKNPLF